MRFKRRLAESHESSHGIDLAPMLDFVINLLIFFIITAVFVKATAVVVNRPDRIDAPPPEEESKNAQIQITPTGDIYMDSRQIDVRAVRANVERIKALNTEAGALILADKQSPTSVLIAVVDQVHLGGIYNITFTATE
jgi:biopolymer transport protein ExbD